MKFVDVLDAKTVYKQGKNVTEYLREKFGSDYNTSEIIEIAYDLQAGSYINAVNSDRDKAERYAKELSQILSQHLASGESLLDVGTGEITTLSLVLNEMNFELSDILALDISWSRLSHGINFHRKIRKTQFSLKPFTADIKEIPLHGKSIDVITSSHALEPNGESLETILNELFRVAKKKLVLFEPSYELNSERGRARMDKLGYIKDIEGVVGKLGGRVVDVIPITNIGNALNPTACYIIEPPHKEINFFESPKFSVPGTDFRLEIDGQFLFSKDTGLMFPILEDIPILKLSSAILASAKC